MAFTLYLNLICALRSRHRLLARSEPFCSCTASCSQPPIPRASGLYRAPSAPGDRNCEAVPLGGPAVPLSPGVSLSMSTGWETGLSPSPSVRYRGPARWGRPRHSPAFIFLSSGLRFFFYGCPVCRLYGHQVAWSRRRAATRFKIASAVARGDTLGTHWTWVLASASSNA